MILFSKGWQNPPLAAGVTGKHSRIQRGETLDAIKRIFSHLPSFKTDIGFSTDDVLTAWYGTSWCPTAQTALDWEADRVGGDDRGVAFAGAQLSRLSQERVFNWQKNQRRTMALRPRYEIRMEIFRERGPSTRGTIRSGAW